MKRYHYKCKLLSEVILTTAAGSESPEKSLDYIPGSKFLGIAAKSLYDESSSDTLRLFHSGEVRFGNAYPVIDENPFVPVPNSYFTEKGKGLDSKVYLHHKISKSEAQLKQAREGYIHLGDNGSFQVRIDQYFKLKSGYDSKKRKSEDSKMFGYFSLPEGSEWYFTVADDTGEFENKIKQSLEGKRKIGRSKTAEYGLIEVSYLKTSDAQPSQDHSSASLIYALTDLCFLNEYGDTTAQPSALQLTGDASCKIDWDLSQVRSRVYQNWNGKRGARDTDRIIIQKGSIFYVKGGNKLSADFFNVGIGSFKAEGFGQVLINPDFLNSTDEVLPFVFHEIKKENNPLDAYPDIKQNQVDIQVLALKNLVKRDKSSETIRTVVLNFKRIHKNKFSSINNSQWGMLGGYAAQALNAEAFGKMVFDPNIGALHRGASEPVWRGCREILEEKFKEIKKEDGLKAMLFIKKLVKEMPIKDAKS